MGISRPTIRAWLIFAALVAVVYAIESAPTEVEKAIALNRGGDHVGAVEIFRRLAEEGDGVAQFNLSGMYRDGRGVSRNITEATRWLQESAQQGIVSAQVELSHAYRYGRGVVGR